MSPRFFSRRQKVDLYLQAQGRCESCGVLLGKGWHADHKKAWSRGGATAVSNGAALCPTCNQMKGARTIMPEQAASPKDPRRKWQSTAVDQFLGSAKDSFLVTATPGAGKTRMALRAAEGLLKRGAVERIIVVAPTNHLTEQWKKEAQALHGLDLSRTPLQAHNCDGLVTTYQAVASDAHRWADLAGLGSTLVILDEAHHAGDNKSWGDGISTAFAGCTKKLLLSGTPFRTDGSPIPFVEYGADGFSVSDAGVTFKEAVADGMIRPVRFTARDGLAKWMEDLDERESMISGATGRDRSKALATIRKSDGDWIRGVLEQADRELKRIRKEEMPDAGGLVIANSMRQAENYGRLLKRISGTEVDVVHSDMPDASAKIDGFRRDGDRLWLVSVAMVSEGVDIPRLCVGVHLTSRDTEMTFRQIVGRFIRMRGDGKAVTSTIFIPDTPSLVDKAMRIEEEVRQALAEADAGAAPSGLGTGQSDSAIGTVFTPLLSSAPMDSSVIVPGGVALPPAEVAHAGELAMRVGGSVADAHPADLAMLLREAGLTFKAVDKKVDVDLTVTGDDRRKELRTRVNSLVNKWNRESGRSHQALHAHLNNKFGGELKAASEKRLLQRIDYVNHKLADLEIRNAG